MRCTCSPLTSDCPLPLSARFAGLRTAAARTPIARSGLGLLLAGVLLGCADDDPSYDARLADLAAELVVSVDVLGTPEPATPRRLVVVLDPGPSATIDPDNLCPVIEAEASVNGLALVQTGKGEYFSSGGGGILS